MKRILTCAALLLGAAATAENPKITITGLRSDRGLVLWTLQGADNTHRQGMEQPAAGQAVIEPGPIRADSAMLYVLHDENGNYRLDCRDDGTPDEGVGSFVIRRDDPAGEMSVELRYDFGPKAADGTPQQVSAPQPGNGK